MALAFVAGLMVVATAAGPLAAYVDHARVVVVSAPATADPAFQRQLAALGRAATGLHARDLVVVEAVGTEPRAEAIRRSVQLHADRFGVALAGKDGGVKLRSAHPLASDRLFHTSDARPMRRREMRRDGGD